MDDKPVEGVRQKEEVEQMDQVVGDVEPTEASQATEQAKNVFDAVGIQPNGLKLRILGKGPPLAH